MPYMATTSQVNCGLRKRWAKIIAPTAQAATAAKQYYNAHYLPTLGTNERIDVIKHLFKEHGATVQHFYHPK